MVLSRKRNQSIQEYSADFERALRKLESHQAQLPDKVVGWWYLRCAGLTKDQCQMIMSHLGSSAISLETICRGVNFVIGQDASPDNNAVKTNATSRWSRAGKEPIFYGDDGEDDWDDDEWEDDDAYWFDEGAAYNDDDAEEETEGAYGLRCL